MNVDIFVHLSLNVGKNVFFIDITPTQVSDDRFLPLILARRYSNGSMCKHYNEEESALNVEKLKNIVSIGHFCVKNI